MNLSLPTGKQRRSILEATERINIWHGSVRSGKTVASILRWLDFIENGPPGELLMVGKTERTLKRNILDPISELLDEDEFNLSTGKGEATILGRRVYLAGANDERSESKIRGLTLVGAYGDEITLWPESFFTMLLSRLSVRGAAFFGTTNPDSPHHWLKKKYLDRAEELRLRHWSFGLEDNPNLDPEYVESLKREYTGLWHKRFILGQWVLAEGVVYDMWDEDVHVVDDGDLPGRFLRHFVAVDYGTGNPTTFLLFGEAENGVLYQLDEYYWDSRARGRQKEDSEYADDFQKWLPEGLTPAAILIDPSAASFITTLRNRRANDPRLANIRPADNDVINGIRRVSTRLSQKRLFVHRRCIETRKEYAAYTWDPKAQVRGEDKPLKENDHCMDSVRYMVNYLDARNDVLQTGRIELVSW